jgi:hypothetical protein
VGTSTMRPCPSPNGTNHSKMYLRTVLVRRDQMDRLDRLALDAEPSEETILRREGMSLRDIQALIDRHTGKSDPRGSGKQGTIVGSTIEGAGEDEDPPVRHPSPLQNKGDAYQSFADHLRRNHGFSAADLAGALRANALDVARRHSARDVLPRNASGASAHGGGMPGGHISGGRTDPVLDDIRELAGNIGNEGETETERIIRRDAERHGVPHLAHAFDAKRRGAQDRSGEEIGRVRELVKRFGPEAGATPDRGRHAMDSAERQKGHFAKRFPDIAANMSKIGDMISGDGSGIRNAPWKDRIGGW